MSNQKVVGYSCSICVTVAPVCLQVSHCCRSQGLELGDTDDHCSPPVEYRVLSSIMNVSLWGEVSS